jgi:hypothetical protein
MANEQTLETVRPVLIQYPTDIDPTPEHPAGFIRGQTFEVPTPEQAWALHPHAVILRYMDGGTYSDAAARKEVRERDKATSDDDTAVKRSKGSVRRVRSRKGQDTPDVEIIVPAAPDALSMTLTNADGGTVTVEPVETTMHAESEG